MAKKVNKKPKKSSSKIRKALHWLKPTSPAKGLLLFVLCFTVIGGSYQAYRSFAATAEVRDYGVNGISGCSGAYQDTDKTSSSKAPVKVWVIPSGSCAFVNVKNVTQTGPWRMCVLVRGVNSGNLAVSLNMSNGRLGGSEPKTITGSKNYSGACTEGGLYTSTGTFRMQLDNNGNEALYLQDLIANTF